MITLPADHGTHIILTDGYLRIPGSIQRHTLHLSPERSTATLRIELCPGLNPISLDSELTLELRDDRPGSLPCRLERLSLSGRIVDITVDLQTREPIARVQKKRPCPGECQHFLESKADDLCLVLTRGSLMEPGELAPRCKDALRMLFSESERVKPVQICHELARTLAALQSEADDHPLLWPVPMREKTADLLDHLNRLSVE